MLRDWTDSLRLDGISADAERLFVRLIMKADDFGRFHADPRLIKAGCFPLVESLGADVLKRWLLELENRRLILRYVADGRLVLAIVNYGQRLKCSRARFPPFPGQSEGWLPTSDFFREVPGSSRNFPSEEKGREYEGEKETEVERENEVESERENEPEGETETKVGNEPEGEGKPPNPRRGDVRALADAIWQLCPRFGRERSSLTRLRHQLARLPVKVLVDDGVLLDSLRAWKLSASWTDEGGRYVPGIHRWVRDGKWRNPPEPAALKKGRFAGIQEDIDLPV